LLERQKRRISFHQHVQTPASGHYVDKEGNASVVPQMVACISDWTVQAMHQAVHEKRLLGVLVSAFSHIDQSSGTFSEVII
jgi:hypothetical protein